MCCAMPEQRPQAIPLDQIERAVFSGQHEQAATAVLQMLQFFSCGGGLPELPEAEDERQREFVAKCATRLSTAFCALMADPKFQLSDGGFMNYALNLPSLAQLVQTSAYRNLDHLMALVSESKGGSIQVNSRSALMKLLLCLHPESGRAVDIPSLLKAAPDLGVWVYFSLLGNKCVLTPEADRMRASLLGAGALLDDMRLHDDLLERVVNVWMMCSYADLGDRHHIKARINQSIRAWLRDKGVTSESTPAPPERERPRILVAMERFSSGHAMYRCYAASIESLRGHYEVVGMAPRQWIDDRARALFDEVVTLPDQNPADIQSMAAEVRRQAPDILYFPSLGMSAWTVALANMRLAPIQIMTPGHPASSYSDTVDYMVLGRDHVGRPEQYSEKLVVLRSTGFQNVVPEMAPLPPPARRAEAPEVQVAVVSKSFKMTARFLDVCGEIAARSSRPLRFHFFPSEAGMMYQFMRDYLQRRFPGSRVLPTMDYGDYLHALNACDIRLGTFPFGGTNSTIDSLRLGIPTVTKRGEEVSGLCDARTIRLCGLPEWLITASDSDYVETALRLIEDDDARYELSRHLLDNDIDEVLFKREQRAHAGDFLDALRAIQANHDKWQASDERCFHVGDWLTQAEKAVNA